MNRPSFFVVGHSKSGTTALSRFLHQHPELFVCDPEETNYFSPSLCRADGPPSRFFRRSEEDYLALFDEAPPGSRCGEASAVYLYSSEAADRIHTFCADARIIMIFREPASFVRSYHLQMLKNTPTEGETVGNLAKAIDLEEERRAGRALPAGCLIPELLMYASDRLRYDEHFDRFARCFPREQILPLVYDDFRRDNASTVRRVLEFLKVDPSFEPVLSDHNTGGQKLRSRRLQQTLERLAQGSGAIAAARHALPRRLRRRALDAAYAHIAFEPAPPLDPELITEIQRRAAPHVRALGERLGRDLLEEWGYHEALRPSPRLPPNN